jgi:hypothetical protein
MKKTWAVIIVIVIAIIAFWYFYNRRQDYSVEYTLNGYNVTESFNVKHNIYYIKISNSDHTYETFLNINYSPRRKIVTEINFFKQDNMECIKLNDNILEYPICKQNDEYVSYYYNTIFENEMLKKYNNIEIYDLMSHNYLVWNYRGFHFISGDKMQTINLFENDTYVPYLLQQMKESLFITDYDSKYEFNKYYLINMKKGTSKEYELERKLSSSSYILGVYKNSIYLIDPKVEQEYEINIKKGKIYQTSPKLLINNEWEKTTIDSILNQERTFVNDEYVFFKLIDKTLYYVEGNINTKITNLSVDSIISYDKEEVYFIANGTVYNFKLNKGLTKVMKYSEWNFNYTNCVFVYDSTK